MINNAGVMKYAHSIYARYQGFNNIQYMYIVYKLQVAICNQKKKIKRK